MVKKMSDDDVKQLILFGCCCLLVVDLKVEFFDVGFFSNLMSMY